MSGRVVIMGSGELAPGLVATHRAGIKAAGADEVVILNTPFGFQENASELTEKLVDFFATSLKVPGRIADLSRREASIAERERFTSAIRTARYVFAGPGSPSYALDIWREAGVGPALTAVVRAGGTVTFASAAALTLGRRTLPVYEIYKVGSSPHWLDGLDVMSDLGLPCVVVPHWNNAEGGSHDTSRCYIGERRLSLLEPELDVGIIGVDEHTAAVFDFEAGRCEALGRGTVTFRGESERVLESGTGIALDKVVKLLSGSQEPPPDAAAVGVDTSTFAEAIAGADGDRLLELLLEKEAQADGSEARSSLRSMLVQVVDAAQTGLQDPREVVGGYVDLLLDLRSDAKSSGDYATADRIRDGLAALGIEVRDTADGHEWVFSEPR